jgi:hypothetical protein
MLERWERQRAIARKSGGIPIWLPRQDVFDPGRKLELRIPPGPGGPVPHGSIRALQRSEKVPVGALSEMYVQGVSTRLDEELNSSRAGRRKKLNRI